MPTKKTVSPFKKFMQQYLFVILAVLVLILGATTFYFYHKATVAKDTSGELNPTQVQALVAKVGKLIILPSDEVPTVATVSDPSALKDQSFFADAKVGDKVLIYSIAKKAILYDPSVNKIVTVAPVNTADKKASSTTSAGTTATQ